MVLNQHNQLVIDVYVEDGALFASALLNGGLFTELF